VNWQFTPYMIPLLIAGAVSAAMAALVWRRRAKSGARPMLGLLLAGALWAFGNALELGAVGLGHKVFWANVEYTGIALVPVFWLVFAVQYTDYGRPLRHRDLALLLIVPAITLVLVWTDPLHGLMRRNFSLNTSVPVVVVAKEYGPWFWVHTAYSYLLIGSGAVLILRVLYRSSRIYRGQAAALVAAVLLPWLANVLYLAYPSFVHLDITPIAFVGSGSICAWALMRYGLLDLVPAAHHAVLQGMADALLVVDEERRLVDMNPAAGRILGTEMRQVLGQPIERLAPEGWPLPPLGEAPSETELQATAADRTRWFSALASPLADGRGRVRGWVLVLRDITERKAIEAERERLLGEVERRAAELDATIASMAEGVSIHGPGGEILRASPRAEAMMGLEADGQRLPIAKLLARVPVYRPNGEPYAPSQFPALRALRGETVRGELAVLRDAQGGEHWVSASAAPIRDQEGHVLGAVVTATDITALRRVEQELARSREDLERRVAERTEALQRANEALQQEVAERNGVEQALAAEHRAVETQRRRLRAVLDILPVGVVIVGRNGHIEEANAAATALWRGAPPYVLGAQAAGERHIAARWAASGAPVGWREWATVRALDRGETSAGEEIDVAIGDEHRTLLHYAVPIRDAQEHVVGAVAVDIDITAHKRAERALQALNEALEERIAQRTGELRASESRFRAIFQEAALGIALTDREGRITASNAALEAMLGYRAEELAGLPYDALCPRLVDNGDARREATLYDELVAGARTSYRLERQCRHRDGHLLRVRQVVSLLRGGDGDPGHAVRMLEDVTQQRETEAALLQAEKLAVTGRLAASFAHEIGNPLQSILGVLALVREGLSQEDETFRLLRLAEGELERATDMVRQLRDLHRPSEPAERRPTDIRDLLEAGILLTRRQAQSRGVAVDLEVPEDLPTLAMAPDRMRQVFLNLILNGIEAMPDGGHLRVRTAVTDDPAGVRIDVADTGIGILPEDLPRIFQSFHSTKETGLGLGLFVSHEIVQQHGGYIAVESTPGEGATFTVWLPLEAPGGAAPAEGDAPGDVAEEERDGHGEG
jgi:PAS domain S-box-containing protein